jgi:SPP1 family predicted phage head-tail adaptor
MSISAGRLRHQVTIQRKVEGQDPGTGEPIAGSWELFAKVHASVEPLSARDLISAKAAQSEAKKRIVIRYRTGILPTMRILHGDRVYDIVGEPLEDRDSGREYLTILVSMGLNNG